MFTIVIPDLLFAISQGILVTFIFILFKASRKFKHKSQWALGISFLIFGINVMPVKVLIPLTEETLPIHESLWHIINVCFSGGLILLNLFIDLSSKESKIQMGTIIMMI
ncbi:MAG: hypothetical protein ACTSRA_11585, partial [Promethearchaeota archaeon]